MQPGSFTQPASSHTLFPYPISAILPFPLLHPSPYPSIHQSTPKLALTRNRHRLGNSLLLPSLPSRNNLAASRFAGLSSLGSSNKEMTESKMVSGVCTGFQR